MGTLPTAGNRRIGATHRPGSRSLSGNCAPASTRIPRIPRERTGQVANAGRHHGAPDAVLYVTPQRAVDAFRSRLEGRDGCFFRHRLVPGPPAGIEARNSPGGDICGICGQVIWRGSREARLPDGTWAHVHPCLTQRAA